MTGFPSDRPLPPRWKALRDTPSAQAKRHGASAVPRLQRLAEIRHGTALVAVIPHKINRVDQVIYAWPRDLWRLTATPVAQLWCPACPDDLHFADMTAVWGTADRLRSQRRSGGRVHLIDLACVVASQPYLD